MVLGLRAPVFSAGFPHPRSGKQGWHSGGGEVIGSCLGPCLAPERYRFKLAGLSVSANHPGGTHNCLLKGQKCNWLGIHLGQCFPFYSLPWTGVCVKPPSRCNTASSQNAGFRDRSICSHCMVKQFFQGAAASGVCFFTSPWCRTPEKHLECSTLKPLSLKTVMLLVLTSAKRVGELTALSVN